MNPLRRRRAAVLLITAVLATGCSRKLTETAAPTDEQSGAPAAATLNGTTFFNPKNNPGAIAGSRFIDPRSMSESEVQFGIAPKRDSRVTYASDVLVMEQGDKAIRGAGRDGMTWSFDAGAAHVNEFQVGRIIFATSRAVGRIVRLQSSGGTVTVSLAPVQITDVIEKGSFLFSADLDPSGAIIYSAPDFPAVLDISPPAKPAAWRWTPADQQGRFIATAVQLPIQAVTGVQQTLAALTASPVASGQLPAPVDLTNYLKAGVLAGSDGSVGMYYAYNNFGLYMDASAKLMLRGAHVDFVLDIFSKRISTWGMKLSGAVSLVLQVKAHSDLDHFLNAHKRVSIPIDISIPMPIGGVPFQLTFHESFLLTTGFSAKRSILNANGEYTLSGNLFVGWRNGQPAFDPFAQPTAKTDLGGSIEGLSVGMNSLSAGFSIRPMIGIGAFGFNTGVYVGLDFSGSVLKQSDIVLAACRGGYMNGQIDSGVGYQLSTGLVHLINGLLSAFTSYQVPDSGTLIQGPNPTFMQLNTDIPKGCSGVKT